MTPAQKNIIKEISGKYLSEEERLQRDIYRSDKEKWKLFVQMLQRNSLLKKAKITHKS